MDAGGDDTVSEGTPAGAAATAALSSPVCLACLRSDQTLDILATQPAHQGVVRSGDQDTGHTPSAQP